MAAIGESSRSRTIGQRQKCAHWRRSMLEKIDIASIYFSTIFLKPIDCIALACE